MGAETRVRPLVIVPLDPFSDKIGGIKTFVREVVRAAPDDFSFEIIGCTADRRERPPGRWQTLELAGRRVAFLPVLETADVHRRPMVPLSFQFTLAAMARRAAHRFAGRVLQFHHPGPPAGFIAVDAPRILTVHLNVADIDTAGGESRWRRAPGLLHRFEDLTLPRMDRIFLVNRAGLEFYRTRHPSVADRVAFLPTSVDQDHFRPPDPAARAAARAALAAMVGADPRDRMLLFVGRLEAQKDPVLLVDAFAAAAPHARGLQLIVVGEGGLRGAVQEHARRLHVDDLVHLVGFRSRDELPAILGAADALLLPSRFEGMPITVLEALACGLPVVATAVGEIPLVVEDRVNGRLVTERTPRAIADAIGWTLAADRERLASAARASVAPYSPAATLAPYFAAHRALSADHVRRR